MKEIKLTRTEATWTIETLISAQSHAAECIRYAETAPVKDCDCDACFSASEIAHVIKMLKEKMSK